MKNKMKQQIMTVAAEDLAVIEQRLEENLTPYLERVREIAGHILFSGGKRLRPLLSLLSSRICNYRGDYAETFSVMFEYLHTATLLHDDLVDGADVRRGKPVANAVWDNPSAVLVGDYLLARASSIAAATEKLEIFQILSRIMEEMAQGELHQLARKGDAGLSEAEYLQIIRNKTAVLMSGACQSGAILAGAPETWTTALAEYGLCLGMAFQMADDLLDYTADTGQTGKSTGADLQEGKYTLPLIYALSRADATDRRAIMDIVAGAAFSRQILDRFNTLLEKHGGFAYTESCAAGYVARAKDALSVFPPGESRSLLMMLADYAVARND